MLSLRIYHSVVAVTIWLPLLFSKNLLSQDLTLVDSTTNDKLISCIIYDTSGRVLGYVDSNINWIYNKYNQYDLNIYCLGYDTLRFSLKDSDTLRLRRKIIELNTVEVYSCYNTLKMGALQGRLQKRIGTKMAVLSQHVRLFEPDTSLPGSCLITKASVFMTKTDDRQSSTLRLRMYSTQKDTLLPGHDVLHESVLLDVSNTGDWYTTDVTDQQIYLREPLFIGWETVTVDGNLPPEYGTIVEKYPMVSYSWDVEYQFWRLFGHALMQDWKRKPNYAIQLELNCPCED